MTLIVSGYCWGQRANPLYRASGTGDTRLPSSKIQCERVWNPENVPTTGPHASEAPGASAGGFLVSAIYPLGGKKIGVHMVRLRLPIPSPVCHTCITTGRGKGRSLPEPSNYCLGNSPLHIPPTTGLKGSGFTTVEGCRCR